MGSPAESPNAASPGNETPSNGWPSFAGVLSALTAPEKREEAEPLDWGDGDPSGDAAVFSYEHALRAQASYSPADWQAARAEPPEIAAAQIAPDAQEHAGSLQSAGPIQDEGRNRKSASVTIRLSQAECMQLKKRAADAGLTISAYLRSCTFEAEALRAQVKEALAALRTESSPEKESAPIPSAHAPRRWWQIRPQADPHSTPA